MFVNEILGALSWLSFSSHHADVLAQRTQSLTEEFDELKSQSDTDVHLFARELSCAEGLSRGLDKVKEVALEIDSAIQEALPALEQKVTRYREIKREIEDIAVCAYVPDPVVEALKELHAAIKIYKEVRNHDMV